MHELLRLDSEFHIEKNKLSQHLMILSVQICLRFAKKTKEKEEKQTNQVVLLLLNILVILFMIVPAS